MMEWKYTEDIPLIPVEIISVEIHYTIGDEILIGRNAMKHFLVTFDGKKGKIIFGD